MQSLLKLKNSVIILTITFIVLLSLFVRSNTHFSADDIDHFSEATTSTLAESMLTRIDVHFAPFHKLSSYLIFHTSPLNFDLALAVMVTLWLLITFFLYKLVRGLIPSSYAYIITGLVACSPIWFHLYIWWSASAHRLPYLLLQTISLALYLKYRNTEKKQYFAAILALQIISIGFYVKTILLPFILMAIELCLYLLNRKISLAAIKLSLCSLAISLAYVAWYISTKNSYGLPVSSDLYTTITNTKQVMLQLFALIFLLPIPSTANEYASGVIILILITFSIARRPRTIFPILALLSIIFFSTLLNTYGRGDWVVLAFGSMRYFSEDIIVIAFFISLILSQHINNINNNESPTNTMTKKLAFILLFFAYVALSLYNSISFSDIYYKNQKKSNIYFNNISKNLKQLESDFPNTKILISEFPDYVYGFLGARKSISPILPFIYKDLKFIDRNYADSDFQHIDYYGNIKPVFTDSPNPINDWSYPDWSIKEPNHRWSAGNTATILFAKDFNKTYTGKLKIIGPYLDMQRVIIYLNDQFIDSLILDARDHCCEWSVNFSPSLLKDGLNKFVFELPDARQPGNGDPRVLAIGVSEISIN